jgi:Tfp pilus assembly protein PilF
MRGVAFLAVCGLAFAQAPDPAYEPLTRAYEALRGRDYDTAIASFLKGIEAAPRRASIRKDLAYTYLKIGENELARDQFGEAIGIDPNDTQVAMEYAFLCYETKEQQQARRIFDRIRKTGDATAEQAFRNIDAPLAAGIERWTKAIEMGADNFSAHFELATLAEQRDELALAAEHYEKAWRLLPGRRSVLVDLGRVWKALDRTDDSTAALLAASRGGEPRAAEMARELLPRRYPYVLEFRRALELDPPNVELRRELAYLLLRMDRQPEAEQEFQVLTRTAPDDLLAAAQLGFLLYARGEHTAAMPLFDRVLAGKDEDLANRVRAVLRIPQVLKARGDAPPASIDAKVMAERSIKAGYMKDALKYLQIAHEDDPGDFEVMLKLGWTYNILHEDLLAFRWFDLARKSPDPQVASQAARAWHNLHAATERFRTTAWLYPIFSTRWHDLFSYAQIKTGIRTKFPLQPYVSVRFVGDTRVAIGITSPQYLSESSFILAVGVATAPWHGITGWAEAGSAVGYISGHMLPDYRGGVSLARGVGHTLRGESSGWFADTALDGVFVSRFGDDFLVYDQSRFGYAFGPETLRSQLSWNANLTFDSQRQYWANFGETGLGLRISGSLLPQSTYVTFNLLRGAYLINTGNPRRPNFNDFRAGVWYAFTH